MSSVSNEEFNLMLQRVGLDLPPEEQQALQALYETFQSRLALLHSSDVNDDEVASIFTAGWTLG